MTDICYNTSSYDQSSSNKTSVFTVFEKKRQYLLSKKYVCDNNIGISNMKVDQLCKLSNIFNASKFINIIIVYKGLSSKKFCVPATTKVEISKMEQTNPNTTIAD
ncbi:Hypothetical protein CINCED_3A022596 [Cinara cedri]|uniref:Uncharacterized protein n=1 Tax=Cinara cedri TaxID=506608 RepID=A0A5E4M4S4_9HEMI|nr:Hypothetical protein CINCED_3A022596 [Cinara cedri]